MPSLIAAAVLLELSTSGGITGKGSGRTTVYGDYYRSARDGRRSNVPPRNGLACAPWSCIPNRNAGEQSQSPRVRMNSSAVAPAPASVVDPAEGDPLASTAEQCRQATAMTRMPVPSSGRRAQVTPRAGGSRAP